MSPSTNTPKSHTLAELHTHSTASDGQHPPAEVARLCAEKGIAVWSLTDHDTLMGCRAAQDAARDHGITFIPGVEVSARHGCSVHVLGYGLDPTDPDAQEFFEERKDLRKLRMKRMIAKAHDHGLDVAMDDVVAIADGGALARPHLARVMVQKGIVSDVQAAFDRYLDEGQSLYEPSPYLSVPEAIEVIHGYGGVAILAHPVHYGLDEVIPAWIDAGLDGIEVAHPSHRGDAEARYTAIAERHGVLKTASSDFHGEAVAPDRRLGVTYVHDTWLDALRARLGV